MSFLFYLEVFTAVLAAALIYLWRKLTYWDRMGVPNTGALAQFTVYKNRQARDVEIECYNKYGHIYGSYFLFQPVLNVGSLDHVRDILIKDFSKFRNHTMFPHLDRRLDLNVFLLRDEQWKRMRTILTPVFSSSKLRSMSECIVPCIDTFITNISKLSSTPISVKKYFDCLTMDVIVSCAYGNKIDCLNDPNNEIVLRASQIFQAIAQSFSSIFGGKFVDISCFEYISKLTMELVAKRRNGTRREDFLQILVDAKYNENGPTLTDDEICGFGISFFSDGYETTSNILTALSYFLATNKSIQSKLYEEVSKVTEVNADTVTNLKYLDGVVKETVRLWPPILKNDRLASEDYKLAGTGITIPKGMTVFIPTYAIHKDPINFPDPEAFKPERYLSGGENEEFNPLSLLTFGAGPRLCIGQKFATMQIKLATTRILQKMQFVATEDTKLEVPDGPNAFLFPNDVYIQMIPR